MGPAEGSARGCRGRGAAASSSTSAQSVLGLIPSYSEVPGSTWLPASPAPLHLPPSWVLPFRPAPRHPSLGARQPVPRREGAGARIQGHSGVLPSSGRRTAGPVTPPCPGRVGSPGCLCGESPGCAGGGSPGGVCGITGVYGVGHREVCVGSPAASPLTGGGAAPLT